MMKFVVVAVVVHVDNNVFDVDDFVYLVAVAVAVVVAVAVATGY